jgi:hypothetical protein
MSPHGRPKGEFPLGGERGHEQSGGLFVPASAHSGKEAA